MPTCPGPRRGLRCPPDPRRPRLNTCALNEQVLALRAFDAARKPIAAVCHGASCWPPPVAASGAALSGLRPEVRLAGGEYVDIPSDQAHVDGHLVTAPAWPAHPARLARFLCSAPASATETRRPRAYANSMKADPILYESRSRSAHPRVVTTLRLENQFWDILREIAEGEA